MTTKEARQRLQGIVSHVANIDFYEIHQCAHNQINMETVRRIAKLNSKKADAFISLLGELTSQRDSMRALFAVADPAVLVTFTYRYIVIIRYLTTAPPDSSLYLSTDNKRFLEQTLIELYREVHTAMQGNRPRHPLP